MEIRNLPPRPLLKGPPPNTHAPPNSVTQGHPKFTRNWHPIAIPTHDTRAHWYPIAAAKLPQPIPTHLTWAHWYPIAAAKLPQPIPTRAHWYPISAKPVTQGHRKFSHKLIEHSGIGLSTQIRLLSRIVRVLYHFAEFSSHQPLLNVAL